MSVERKEGVTSAFQDVRGNEVNPELLFIGKHEYSDVRTATVRYVVVEDPPNKDDGTYLGVNLTYLHWDDPDGAADAATDTKHYRIEGATDVERMCRDHFDHRKWGIHGEILNRERNGEL